MFLIFIYFNDLVANNKIFQSYKKKGKRKRKTGKINKISPVVTVSSNNKVFKVTLFLHTICFGKRSKKAVGKGVSNSNSSWVMGWTKASL